MGVVESWSCVTTITKKYRALAKDNCHGEVTDVFGETEKTRTLITNTLQTNKWPRLETSNANPNGHQYDYQKWKTFQTAEQTDHTLSGFNKSHASD